jgi:hypothetical protein
VRGSACHNQLLPPSRTPHNLDQQALFAAPNHDVFFLY